ncbi:MAG: ferritin-like domain-containing protein [Candidatus Poseidoniaceae archaeon]|nr:ferritin-like domain-containing protein [Candidatus Poseidoniaceae archaeon]MBL6889426.1 ferritin-like domain-containing protein [Candidatus Poseidoniaceae archaeon]
MSTSVLIEKLNQALGWELRAINMYAHYAAYIRGIHRLQLEPHFSAEANESMVHSNIVRSAIVKLGGVAVTERNQTSIRHTTSYLEMLAESLITETKAAEVYGELITMIEEDGDADLYDAIEQIYLAEIRSVEELRRLAE